jgi:hypothetical protein
MSRFARPLDGPFASSRVARDRHPGTSVVINARGSAGNRRLGTPPPVSSSRSACRNAGAAVGHEGVLWPPGNNAVELSGSWDRGGWCRRVGPAPGRGRRGDREGFSFREGFSSNVTKILLDHGLPVTPTRPSGHIRHRPGPRPAPRAPPVSGTGRRGLKHHDAGHPAGDGRSCGAGRRLGRAGGSGPGPGPAFGCCADDSTIAAWRRNRIGARGDLRHDPPKSRLVPAGTTSPRKPPFAPGTNASGPHPPPRQADG